MFQDFTRRLAPELSIVVPAFNESANLGKLCHELRGPLSLLGMSWEIILVDDGSTDDTWSTIAALHEEDPRIKGVRFSRNFGHQYALLAGLTSAVGKATICMDADLQHPPEIIPKLVAEWRAGNKIVHTVRLDSTRVPLLKRVTGRVFYRIFSFLTGVAIEPGMADFRLFDRHALNSILQFGEQGLFLRGIVQWIGFPTSQVVFRSGDRYSGQTKYTWRKMLKFALDGITSFSIVPLRVGMILGILTSGLAFWLMAEAIYAKVVLNATVPGWATTITVMSFMFGMLFILMGLLGEYIGRVLIQVRLRPRFIVSDQIGIAEPTVDAPAVALALPQDIVRN
jgi:dolichol-phosphate mannosyltransferase